MLLLVHDGVVVFDGDDTLWFTEVLFYEARVEAANVVASAGFDSAAWERIERRLDVENVRVLGFSPDRFPTSCVQAYQKLVHNAGLKASPEIETRIWRAASTPFLRSALAVPNATALLESLTAHFKLALITKGVPEIQLKRIQDAGLYGAFDHIVVVPQKGADEFSNVVRLLGSEPRSAWSVGNSIVSDIVPALRLGMNAIWIDAPVWEYERLDAVISAG